MEQNYFEEWRPVVGFDGLYEVSDQGRVRSLARDVIRGKGRGGLYHLPQRVLKPGMNTQGYLFVILYKDGKGKLCAIHRLVAEAFLANPNDLPQVNHIDEDKTNNCVDNLEWCTAKYNMNHGTRTARQATAVSKPVQQFSKDGSLIAVWSSGIEAEQATGVYQSSICNCCNGKLRSAGGYVWRYT